MTKPIRMCYFPAKGCPDNEGEECYADYYPDRLTCQAHYENYWDGALRDSMAQYTNHSVKEGTE